MRTIWVCTLRHGKAAGVAPVGCARLRPQMHQVSSLAARKLLIVTGKGGVGKTTISAALALQFASQGKRVLLAMCNTQDRMGVLFGREAVGPDLVSLGRNVWAVNIDPERALEEYGVLTLKSRTLYRMLFDNKYVRVFLRAIPGMYEWAMLGKAWWHTTETSPDGSPRFDMVIVDAPATGHGLDMMRVPRILCDIAPPGILRRDAEASLGMMRDAARSGVVVVCLPEEMPVTETLELLDELKGSLSLPLAAVIVNAAYPSALSAEGQARLHEARPEGTEAQAAQREVLAYEERLSMQKKAYARLCAALGSEPPVLAYAHDSATPRGVEMLAERLVQDPHWP